LHLFCLARSAIPGGPEGNRRFVGYISAGNDASREANGFRPYIFAREAETNPQGKRDACIGAAELIEPGDTIFIDCGTTLPELATRLPTVGSLTVVCYAMPIAEIVCERPNLIVMMLGGLYRASSASFYSSPESLEMLWRIATTKAFISAGGVHIERGVSCSNFHEVPIKQKALEVSFKSYVVVDSSKFGVVWPAFFAPLTAFDAVVTDAGLTAADRAALAQTAVPALVLGDRNV
jgi:DeoR family deoxyribose operon repressor